jgi:hypothetical protein
MRLLFILITDNYDFCISIFKDLLEMLHRAEGIGPRVGGRFLI